MMRHWLGRAVVAPALASSACGGARPEEIRTADVITACAPVASPLPEGETMAYMAGRYEVELYRERSRAQTRGLLDLEAAPEDYRNWGASTATLSGTADIDLAQVGAQPMDGLDSDDPAAPGVLVLEGPTTAGPSIVVRFGSTANRQDNTPFDGPYAALQVLVVEGDRFAGEWRSGTGNEQVDGYFCARRLDR